MNKEPETYEELIRYKRCVDLTYYGGIIVSYIITINVLLVIKIDLLVLVDIKEYNVK